MIQDVDKWIAELKDAGWVRHATQSTIWVAPSRAWYRGPYKAWCIMKGIPCEAVPATPPEPREPEAREAAAELLLQYPDIDEYYATDKPITRATAIEFALAYSAELRAERDAAIKLRDEYLETGQRIQGDFERARAAYEASERSLLQTRKMADWFEKHWAEINAAGIYDRFPIKEIAAVLASTSAPSSEAAK